VRFSQFGRSRATRRAAIFRIASSTSPWCDNDRANNLPLFKAHGLTGFEPKAAVTSSLIICETDQPTPDQHADGLGPGVAAGFGPVIQARDFILWQPQRDYGIAPVAGLPRPRFFGLTDIDFATLAVDQEITFSNAYRWPNASPPHDGCVRNVAHSYGRM
jgi:hypothetical protein